MPAWWLPYVQAFLTRLQPLFAAGPLRVTSFVRTRSHNAAVGGEPDSQHLVGTAIDLVPVDGDLAGLEAYARQLGWFGYVLNEGDHIHVQLFRAGAIPSWVFDLVARA